MTLTIENDQTPENGTLDCTVASLRHIKELGGNIGYTFDLGNWFWRGENAGEAFAQLLPAITVFHLKNVNGAATREELATTMLEDGVIDWKTMLRSLTPRSRSSSNSRFRPTASPRRLPRSARWSARRPPSCPKS